MKKFISVITGFIASIMLVTVAYGGDTSTATFVQTIVIKSTVPSIVTQQVDSADVSTQALATGSYINATSMNLDLHESGSDIPFMPGTKNIDVLYAWNNAGTEETTQATNIAAGDMTLPTDDGEIYEFAFDHAARFLKLRIQQAIVGTDTVVHWEYYNGSWLSLSPVTDGTNSFANTGESSVSWDIPSNWTRETLHSQTGYWMRARLTSVGTPTTPPTGSRAWYETGKLFYYVDSIASIDQLNYDLYMGGTVDIRDYHSYFPGALGIQKDDDSDMELLDGEWKFDIKNAFRLDTNESGFVFNKPNSLSLGYSNTAISGGDNTLTLSSTGTDYIGEWTHNEEDGEGYYNNTSQESYSKAFYNAASNYITAQDEITADVLSNSSSEVSSNKIGQAYDKTIDTTPSFGAKIDDPT